MAGQMQKKVETHCDICGQIFMGARKSSRTCRDQACINERNRRNSEKYRNRYGKEYGRDATRRWREKNKVGHWRTETVRVEEAQSRPWSEPCLYDLRQTWLAATDDKPFSAEKYAKDHLRTVDDVMVHLEVALKTTDRELAGRRKYLEG